MSNAAHMDKTDKNERKTLPFMVGAHLINDLYMMILPPFLPALILAFSLSYSLAGGLITLNLLMAFAISLIAGYLADRGYSRKKILISGFIFYGVAMFILGYVTNLFWLILTVTILGGAQATYHPQAYSIVTYNIGKTKGRAMGIHGVGGSVGHFISPIFAGFLITLFGWKESAFILIVPAIITVVILWRVLNEPSIPSTRGFFKAISGSLFVLIFVAALRDMVYRGFVSFLPSFFVFEGNTLFQAGALTALMLVTGIIAQPLGGGISDKIGRRKITIITSLLLTFSLLGFIVSSGLTRLLFLPFIGFGVFSVFPVIQIWTSELVGSEKTGTSLGLMFGSSQLIGSISPLILGYLIDNWGFISSFYILILFSGLALIFTFIIPETKR